MTPSKNDSKCPRCGESASGKFCIACGAALAGQICGTCATPLTPGSKFCHSCGTPAGMSVTSSGRMPPAWMIAASVLVVLVAFVAGQQFAAPSSPGAEPAATEAPFAGGATRAPDISRMTPEEAANRLFDRVMRYAAEGKPDSAAMFAPMAILAYERIGPLDAHARYDIGTISAVVGDLAAASAQADTVLKAQPNHLLGLLLAAKTADLKQNASAARAFRARFAAAASAERAKNLREYADHQQEIDEALKKSPAK